MKTTFIILSLLMLGIGASAQTGGKALSDVNPQFNTSTEASRTSTAYGDVAGFIDNGVYTYRGIPYAYADRFEEPRAPKAWSGVRSSRWWGKASQQPPYDGVTSDEISFFFHSNMGDLDDHCQFLNVWTPGINPKGKEGKQRPVMVWLHGGGFQAGSSQELPVYNGRNLAAKGDVVVVSVNHRLNCIGFLDLSAFGEKYAHTGNLGMLDIVAALKWVKENIAYFGGDPNNVTIFGQSGGGGKVSTLACMPVAKGLFNKAMVMSGSFSLANKQENARKVGLLTAEYLGLDAKSIDKIKTIPYSDLWKAAYKAQKEVNASQSGFGRVAWGPVAGESNLPEVPFRNGSELQSADIPFIIGSTLNEFSGAQEDKMVRAAAISQATVNFNHKKAPVWLYRFNYQVPSLDGQFHADHSNDIGFFFNNVANCPFITGATPAGINLGETMSSYLLNFVRTGNPNGKGLPEWKTFSPDTEATMIFNVPKCEMKNKD